MHSETLSALLLVDVVVAVEVEEGSDSLPVLLVMGWRSWLDVC